jgi:tetratricopeptide (TPR) repeat protein
VPYREREGLGIVLDALFRLVKIMVFEGDSEGALELIEKAMNELPDDGRPYAFRGWVHEERGETEKALADYRTAVELEPRLMGVHLAMGKIYKQMGDYEKAVIEFELELEVNPWSIEAQEELESLTGGG